MSDLRDEFNIEDILAEFSDYSGETHTEASHSEEQTDSRRVNTPNAEYAEEKTRRIEKIEKSYIESKKAESGKADHRRREHEPVEKEKSRVRKAERSEKENAVKRTPGKAVTALFAVLTLLCIAWIGVNIHPDSGTVTSAAVRNDTNLISQVDVYINNLKSEALGDLAYIKKLYTIPETATSAPRPNEAAFGVTQDMTVVQSVINRASELLDGQSVIWRPDLDFYPDRNVYYYYDATILVLVWRERINNRSATVAEIKVADGSQLRRKLAEDSYGSSVQAYASRLATDANAVVAMNADFYGFRQIGVTVFQRQLFRFSPDKLDNCFINSAGDMLFVKAGGIRSDAEMWKYIADNDVLFSLSFGPILVDNGVLQHCDSYPIGEIDREYSRAGLGMTDDLHYLYMTVNHCNGQNPRCNVNEFAELMYSKGCYKAYNLDGGQTSEIVMHGTPINYIDFNAERTVTDIIYFASALPESEVSE